MPPMLAKFAGTYKAAGGQRADGGAGRRSTHARQCGRAAGAALLLVATGDQAFKAIGAPITLTFQVDGDRIASFTLTQGTIRRGLHARGGEIVMRRSSRARDRGRRHGGVRAELAGIPWRERGRHGRRHADGRHLERPPARTWRGRHPSRASRSRARSSGATACLSRPPSAARPGRASAPGSTATSSRSPTPRSTPGASCRWTRRPARWCGTGWSTKGRRRRSAIPSPARRRRRRSRTART